MDKWSKNHVNWLIVSALFKQWLGARVNQLCSIHWCIYASSGLNVLTSYSDWLNQTKPPNFGCSPVKYHEDMAYAFRKWWRGNAFRITAPVWGKPPVTGGFPSPSHKYINSKPGQAVEQTIEMHNMLTYIQADLACERIHYDAHIDGQVEDCSNSIADAL